MLNIFSYYEVISTKIPLKILPQKTYSFWAATLCVFIFNGACILYFMSHFEVNLRLSRSDCKKSFFRFSGIKTFKLIAWSCNVFHCSFLCCCLCCMFVGIVIVIFISIDYDLKTDHFKIAWRQTDTNTQRHATNFLRNKIIINAEAVQFFASDRFSLLFIVDVDVVVIVGCDFSIQSAKGKLLCFVLLPSNIRSDVTFCTLPWMLTTFSHQSKWKIFFPLFCLLVEFHCIVLYCGWVHAEHIQNVVQSCFTEQNEHL